MGILDGRRVLITGVLTEASLGFAVARAAQEQGADVVLTGAGRGLTITRRTAKKLPRQPDVLEMDVTVPEQVDSVATELSAHWDGLDGMLHAIGFAPPACLGGDMFGATWSEVSTALQISAYSLKVLAQAFRPLLAAGCNPSVVGLDFDAAVAWPAYNWMGVAKAALESLTRYLARDLGPQGIRVNLVAAGPIRTVAAKSIPAFDTFESSWGARAPLGWNVHDATPVARSCLALLSEWLPMTTGEILHVDGGAHAVGA
ncbi:MAG: enoyl-ACP reductase FabI [Actinobacteria bacterium]|nr:enoyl-ACP reductase FabI [Actinomycetota bacterium]